LPEDVLRLRGSLTSALDGLMRGVFDEREGSWCAQCQAVGLCRALARSSGMV
jgi:hypothetical protein